MNETKTSETKERAPKLRRFGLVVASLGLAFTLGFGIGQEMLRAQLRSDLEALYGELDAWAEGFDALADDYSQYEDPQ